MRTNSLVLLPVLAVAAMLSMPAPALGQYAPLPPEMVRLWRHAYDTTYRNANDNVFRNSRHADATRNPFRSSRHYEQKLAAADDGYPLRTFVRVGHGRGNRGIGGPRGIRGRRNGANGVRQRHEDVFSYAHHRGRFASPYDAVPPLVLPDAAYDQVAPQPRREPRRILRARTEPVTQPVPVATPPRAEPKERAVLRTVTQPDGTVRTVITSVPITGSLEQAWATMAAGDSAAALKIFARALFNDDTAAEASAGYAVAAARTGDLDAAASALQRGLDLEPALISALQVDAAMKIELEAIRERLDAADPDGDSK